jgi:fructokinase
MWPQGVALDLMEKFNLNMIAVTRGKDGASIFENGKKFNHTNIETKVIDTTGAGDAFSAMLSIGYLYGFEIPYINKLANDFAYDICQFEGALPKNDGFTKPTENSWDYFRMFLIIAF